MVVAKLDNPNKSIEGSAIRFSVTAAGKNSVVMKSISHTLASAGYASGVFNLYRDSVSTANIVDFTGNVNNTIDVGTTATFIIAYPGMVMTQTSPDRSVSLTDLGFDVAPSVAVFSNVGNFPMVDRK